MASFLVLNGPNLNLLGTRQPEVYGSTTLADIEDVCRVFAAGFGHQIAFEQSNSEGELIASIHGARGVHAGIAFNAGAYTHTSVALMDAVLSAMVPTVEVHLSNVHSREEFRHQSFLAKAAIGVISGFGSASYTLALQALFDHTKAEHD